MKKVFALLLSVVIVFGAVGVCSAQTVNNRNYGLSFNLSDYWAQTYTDNGYAFYHSTNENETLTVESIQYEMSCLVDIVDASMMREICDYAYTDSKLAADLSAQNGADVTVSSESVLDSYEYYNGVKYYRYEKAYTATADGFYPASFYLSAYVTAANGKVYTIVYERDSATNNFGDVVDMLNSVSFESGKIKINIDNERIYPDSEPMLIAGRTLVPIRAIAEKMGYTVTWDGTNQLVTLTSADGSNNLFFEIGNTVAFKNEQAIALDVAATIVGGRTYLPLRAVSEAMDARVNWNGAERTVEIWK